MTQAPAPYYLQGDDLATREILALDWSRTSLGPIAGWPVSLRTAVGMMVASRFPKAIFWGPDLVMLHNEAFRPLFGAKQNVMGGRMAEVWSEIWDEVGPIAARAMAGEATFIEDIELLIDRGPVPERCWFTFCYSPIRDENGQVGGFIDTVIETTGKVQAEHALKVQNAELSHRIRNTLSVVSAIARHTLRHADTPGDAWAVLSARIGALAETHMVLRPGGPQMLANVGEVVRTALQPHGGEGGRYEVIGPDIDIGEAQALALSLAMNELATNATKHGALSVEGGRVTVRWGIDDTDGKAMLRFAWSETGGPRVSPPTRRSFGTEILTSIAPQDFGGEARLDFAPGGVSYTLSCDLRRLKG